jgi:hypothetical protein
MEEQGIILEEATFRFSQDPNCLDDDGQYEFLEVKAQSSIGIDRDGDCFFTISTEKWSVDSAEDFKKIFERIYKVIETKETKQI